MARHIMFRAMLWLGSIQSSAALVEPGVSQQAFKQATGIRVAGVMAARVTPIRKIPIDGTGFGE